MNKSVLQLKLFGVKSLKNFNKLITIQHIYREASNNSLDMELYRAAALHDKVQSTLRYAKNRFYHPENGGMMFCNTGGAT